MLMAGILVSALRTGGSLQVGVKHVGAVTLMDHLNINHEGARQDVLCAFYFDCLGLVADPRKAENLDVGVGTVWANGGSTQFHFSKGDTAQVFDGVIEMAYRDEKSFEAVEQALLNPPEVLKEDGSKFSVKKGEDGSITVTDYHGTTYSLCVDAEAEDVRGSQPGETRPHTPCAAIKSLEVNVPPEASLEGIGRFYSEVLGAPVIESTPSSVAISMGPKQTLRYKHSTTPVPHSCPHDDVRDCEGGIANYGAHISLYLHDFKGAYERSQALGVGFVNHRFKRRAYCLEEAMDQCMFRTLDIVDPAHPDKGVILQLEHEVRSMTQANGEKYKSFPLEAIPPEK